MPDLPLILLPLLGLAGALLPALAGSQPRVSARLAGAVVLAGLFAAIWLAPPVLGGAVLVERWSWLPGADLNLALRLDGLSLLFTLLIQGIGLLIVLYAHYYLPAAAPQRRFYALFLLFAGAMQGMVLAENLLVLVVFWEITSISSFLLIGYWTLDPAARQSARLALTVTGAGGLALLAGVLLLGDAAGGFDLTTVLASGEAVRADPRYPWILGLILAGVFTKSAQFPFHFWLPRAMAAPTPVSAYLHSATMVKAGVFLLARLFPVLAGTQAWLVTVTSVGAVTLLFGAFFALFKHDIKGLLAYSTVSHLGLITMLFGLGTPASAVAGLFHIANHAVFKASLFMAAGIIDHESGSRDMRKLNGLFWRMPYTAVLAMVAAGAMAGVPLLNGFLSKEMFFAETLQSGGAGTWGTLLPLAATLSGVLAVAYSLRFIHDVFFNGEPVGLTREPHEPPRWMKLPVELLVALCLLVGMAPAWTVAPFLAAAAEAVVPGLAPHFDLAVWHGLTPALFMSLTAMAGGVALYAGRGGIFRVHDRYFPEIDVLGWFTRVERAVSGGAERLLGTWENRSLQRYVAVVVTVAVALAGAGFLAAMPAAVPSPGGPPDLPTLLLGVAIALAATATVVHQRRRLDALVWLGVVGLGVSLLFVRLAAPDLALTMLAVEVVSVVLLLLALFFLPQSAPVESSRGRRGRDALLAGTAGVIVGGLVWAGLGVPTAAIGPEYLARTVSETGGANAVNTILVDYRAFDTLGEITVLGIAALGAFAMLRGFALPPARELQGRRWARDAHPLILTTLSRPLLPLAALVSVYLLLRGHNAPGGGFVAGLVMGVALILQYLASGGRWVRGRLRVRYRVILAAGLALASGSGLLPWLWGAPFLASAHGHWHLPGLGGIHWNTTLIFDLGVYLTVIASVTLILAELGRLGQKRIGRGRPYGATAPAMEERS
jgi:multicomponent K+:H+ antiporter subunit A